MTWINIIWLLLRFASELLNYAQSRKAVAEAEAAIVARALKESLDALDKAKSARADAERRFDESGGVPDESDPNLRD